MTKNLFILILLIVINLQLGRAQHATDSSKHSKVRYCEWSKKDFIEKFGANDTSMELIKLFFAKRTRGIVKISLLPVPILAEKLGLLIDENAQKDGDVVLPILGTSSLIISACIIIPLAAVGVYQVIYYSKWHLGRVLKNYEKSGELPDDILIKLKSVSKHSENQFQDDVYH
jgi:hypothetical protein